MKRIILLCMVFTAIFITGCGREIDDMAYVVAIGVDVNEADVYDFTFAIGNPLKINGGGGEDAGGGGEDMLIMEGGSGGNIFTVGDEISARIGQEVNFSHAELLVFSPESAKKGVANILEELTRNLDQRPNLIPAVSKGTAKESLGAINSQFEGNPEKFLKKIFEKDSSLASTKTDIRDFLCRTKNKHLSTALPEIGVEDGIFVNSMAVFTGDKLTGSFDDIFSYKMATGTVKDVSFDMGNMGAVGVSRRVKPKIKVECRDIPRIDISIVFDGTVSAIDENTEVHELYKNAEKKLEEDFKNLLDKSKTMGADVFGFERYARGSFIIWENWESYNWREKYKNAEFNVTVKILPSKTGLIRRGI